MASHRDLLDIATRAARQAAGFIRASARPETAVWDRKARNDFATDVDRGAERMIAGVLLAAVPGSAIVGEELTPEGGPTDRRIDGSVTWIVDPLDGTTNFLHGYPAYAVSIAGLVGGDLAVGVVVDVVRDLTYRAVAGGGASTGRSACLRSPSRRWR
jgi:myo-inositol-1(or 4)-monophosphatase